MPRTKLIAGNWKMYKTPDQTRDFFQAFLPLVAKHDRDQILICPPFVDLHAAIESAKGSNVSHRIAKRSLGKGRRLHRRNFYRHASEAIGAPTPSSDTPSAANTSAKPTTP